ncbi:unnamed protein product [Calypogeia fissa]
MDERYDNVGGPMEEGGYRVKPYRRPLSREGSITSSRGGGGGAGGGLKKPSRWVFISRKADIGIVLVLLLSAGLTIMWLISQLPVFVEAASHQYHWAKDVYTTWGTPSMRWLFINLVVGVIVATSGLLSAFGGDSSGQPTDRSGAGYDKGVSYRGSDSGVVYGDSEPAYNANATEARVTGPGYEAPLYNPYSSEPVRNRLHHESSFDAWNPNRGGESPPLEEMEGRERGEGFRRRGMHAAVDEPVHARPVDPEVMRAARPVSRQGSQRRGMPMPAEDVPMSREVPREMAFDAAAAPKEVPKDMPREVPKDMPPMEEAPPPPRDTPVSKEIPAPTEVPPATAAEDAALPTPSPASAPAPAPSPTPVPVPEPEVAEGMSRHVGGSRKEDAIEIISKVYDPVPAFEEVETDHGKFHRLKTEPAIPPPPTEEASAAERSPAKPENLHKSHTFTLGRVIRRDQLAEFIEPLSRKLEGIGRKVRDPHKRSDSSSESATIKSRDLPAPSQIAANALPPAAIEGSAAQPETHRRRLSAESIPFVAHGRRLSSEAIPSMEGPIPHPLKQSSVPVIKHPFPPIVSKPSPPPSPPLLKQRSIVYPPALLSQASIADEDLSPPPSPPIEEAIPPPPPPHLKLPPSAKDANPSSITSSEELPSFKFYFPTSDSAEPKGPAAKFSKKQVEKATSSEEKKPPSGKHSRTPSVQVPSTSSPLTPDPGSSSSPGQAEQSLMIKPRRSGDGKDQDLKGETSPLDRQDSPAGKDDDLHQQIEDFLARFHENWRLQRQESLARYKKRLVELDE